MDPSYEAGSGERIINGSGILNYDKYLKQTPSEWPHPYIFRQHNLNTNKYLRYILHPRFIRTLRLTLGSVAAYYISLYPTGLGDGGITIFVGMVYMGVSIMNGIYGAQTLGLLLLLAMALVLAFVFSTVLVAVALVDPNPFAVLATYVACMLILSTGRLGPFGIGGSISLNFVFMLATYIFFNLYDFAYHGMHASIPLEDLANSSLLGNLGTHMPIPELVDMIQTQFSLTADTVHTFIVPASISGTLEGATCHVSIIFNALDILIEPGWWIIENILWGSDSSIIAALGPMLWMVVVGLGIYLAMHLIPPYYSANREIRDIHGRILCSLVDKQSYKRPKSIVPPLYEDSGTDTVSLDGHTHTITSSKDLKNDFDAHFYAPERSDFVARSPVDLLLGQAVQSALTTTNQLLNTAANGEPHYFTPCIFARTHDEMRAVDTRIGQLAASIILYNMYFSERHVVQLNNPPELVEAQEQLTNTARLMVDECGRSICTIPTMWNRNVLAERKEQLIQVHKALQTDLDHYNSVAAVVYEQQLADMHREGCSEDEVKKVVVMMSTRSTLMALNFHHHPKNLCVAVENLLDASHRYTISNAVISLYRLFCFYTLLLPRAMRAAFTTFYNALKTLPQKASWSGPTSWYQNRDLHHLIRFNLGTFILFVVPLYSGEFRDWVWPVKESIGNDYTDTPVLGHLQLWCVMTYVLCEAATLEPTVQKSVWRMLGSTVGCLTAYLTLLAAGDDKPWVILVCSVVVHFVVCFLAADRDSTSVVWMQQRWNYFPGVVLITHVVITLIYWLRKDDFRMEFYVLNRFIASIAGALLSMVVSMFVLPMSAGLASRSFFTRSYGAFSASLASAFTAIDTATTAIPTPVRRRSDTSADSETDMHAEATTATAEFVKPDFSGALAMLAGGNALLTGASFYSKWAHSGPVPRADERLRTVERMLNAVSHMAGNVNVVHDLFTSADVVETVDEDGHEKDRDVKSSSTTLLPGVGSTGDDVSLVEGMQHEAEDNRTESILGGKKGLEVPMTKRHRGLSINLVSAKERVLEVIPEFVQMFTGVLLSHSDADTADIPILSALTIDDAAKAANEKALDALEQLHKNAKDTSGHASIDETMLALLDTSFDLEEGAHTLVQHMHAKSAMANTLLALTTAMYLDYSRVCMEFLATHAYTPRRPAVQVMVTAHNAKSRHFVKSMHKREGDEERN